MNQMKIIFVIVMLICLLMLAAVTVIIAQDPKSGASMLFLPAGCHGGRFALAQDATEILLT